MYLIFGLILVLLSIFVLIYTHYIFKSLNSKKQVLFHFIEFLLYYKVFFYLLIPAILRTFSDFQYDKELNIDYIEILSVYVIEVVSYIVWISMLYICLYKFKERKVSIYWQSIAEMTLLVILVLYFYMTYVKFIALFGIDEDTLFDTSLYILKPLIEQLGPVAAFFSSIIHLKYRKNRYILILSVMIICMYAPITLLSGIRHLIIHPAFFTLYLLYIFNYKKAIKILGVFLVVFALFQGVFLEFRNLDKENRLDAIVTSELKDTHKNLIQEIEWRYGEASRMSVALLRRSYIGNKAWFNVIKSGLYAPLPRKYFPNKPIPGSSGEDKFSMAMYIGQVDLRGIRLNMSDFYTGVHAYWEFGLLGVLINSAVSALYISFIVIVLLSIGLIGIPFLFLFFKPFTNNEVKIVLFNIPMQIFQFILQLLVISFFIVIARYFYKRRKYIIQKKVTR